LPEANGEAYEKRGWVSTVYSLRTFGPTGRGDVPKQLQNARRCTMMGNWSLGV
jgi:hypothetical protein